MSLGKRVGDACAKIMDEKMRGLVVANKQDYTARLQTAIQHLHKCRAVYRETIPVHEVFQATTLWRGDIEAFDLTGHPMAKRFYGWFYREPEEFITILELPPVDSAQSAVKVGMSYQVKKARAKKRVKLKRPSAFTRQAILSLGYVQG